MKPVLKREADTDIIRIPEAYPQNVQRPPLCVFPGGRGNRGKTFETIWMIDRSRNAGRLVDVADGDCINQTLASYFSDALSPPSADQITVTNWFTKLIENQIASRRSLVVDFGAGDRTLKAVAHELSLVSFLKEQGVEPVVMHFIGPDPDDLAYLQSFEDNNLFAPEATVIVFNQFCVPPHVPVSTAFTQTVEQNRVVGRVLERGGQIVVMPTLGCSHEIARRRTGFLEAAEGKSNGGLPPLGLIDRQRTRMWLNRMEEAFSHVQHWLP